MWRSRRDAEARLVRAIIDYGYARCGPRLLLHGWDSFMRSETVHGGAGRDWLTRAQVAEQAGEVFHVYQACPGLTPLRDGENGLVVSRSWW